ncbi:hypothetical protein [Mycobacterium attenuatum]|uniref:hypothetical protein n=1 Tax=Mycobacterium attenuatum TaxID=2341086 RepID=UPI000F025B8A|nr:hypothetical protein [Mycobacterium attenuatum]VBA47914.1 hypothetical protein LAUMK41_00637 [Mycobacterium attenuatum]
MSITHRLHDVIEIRQRLFQLVEPLVAQRDAIISRAKAQRRETLTRSEVADFHVMSATIKGIQESVLDADVLIKDLTEELNGEIAAGLPDAEVQPDCVAPHSD